MNLRDRLRGLALSLLGLAERADLERARAEANRLTDLLTPRTYRRGDPQPDRALYWDADDEIWRGCFRLDPGDLWLPMPPSPGEDGE